MTTDDARALKEAGQMASLFGMEQVWDAFADILRLWAPGDTLSVNTLRRHLDYQDIPVSARGGLFSQAVRKGLLEPVVTPEGYEVRVKSEGLSAHAATVRLYRRAA